MGTLQWDTNVAQCDVKWKSQNGKHRRKRAHDVKKDSQNGLTPPVGSQTITTMGVVMKKGFARIWNAFVPSCCSPWTVSCCGSRHRTMPDDHQHQKKMRDELARNGSTKSHWDRSLFCGVVERPMGVARVDDVKMGDVKRVVSHPSKIPISSLTTENHATR